jgi:hypothetical protein
VKVKRDKWSPTVYVGCHYELSHPSTLFKKKKISCVLVKNESVSSWPSERDQQTLLISRRRPAWRFVVRTDLGVVFIGKEKKE